MVKKEVIHQALLNDLNTVWDRTKIAATSWKLNPKQKLTVIVLPISSAINATLNHLQSNLSQLDKTEKRTLFEDIIERLRNLQNQLLLKDPVINSPTQLLTACKIALQNIANEVAIDYKEAKKAKLTRELAEVA